MSFELLKPLQTLKNKNILFNDFCKVYELNKDSCFYPFVLFYDLFSHKYYYLKIQVNVFNDYKPNKFEILIKGTNKSESLLSNNWLIDCSQIFSIDADLLSTCIDENDKKFINTSPVGEDAFLSIINKINELLNEKPPYLSLMDVSQDKNNIISNSIYLCQEKYEQALKNEDISIEKEIISEFAPNHNKLLEVLIFRNLFEDLFQDELYVYKK